MAAGYHVKVTNKNDFAIEDRHDGIPYLMPAMKECKIPYAAACHIFGVDFRGGPNGDMGDMRKTIFRHVQRRWGWNRSDVLEKSVGWFEKIELKLIALKLVEAEETDKDALPAPRGRDEGETGGRGKNGGRGEREQQANEKGVG